MDISKYAAKADAYDRLATYQISRFFDRHKSITNDGCNCMAADILKSPVSPTQVQGGSSYTVRADSDEACKVVQFRSSKLDMGLIGHAKQTYGNFVPNCEYHSPLGEVHTYVMDLIPGPAYCRVRHQFVTHGMELRLSQMVQDFARSVICNAYRPGVPADETRFFASAWINKPDIKQPAGLFKGYSCVLDQVSEGLSLPEKLRAKLDDVRQGLPLLFRPEYPMVIQHDDLLENNIHVDEASGQITGIVDWADAMIAPFGVSLGGIETLLGVQDATSWHLHPSHVKLRKHFWDAFYKDIGDISADDRRSIEIARLFGLFRTHGLGWGEGAARIAYLETLCLL